MGSSHAYNVCAPVACFYSVFFQAEDGIRDLVRSRGLGDVYKRQATRTVCPDLGQQVSVRCGQHTGLCLHLCPDLFARCLLYTSDAADERSSVDLGGRRIIKKKNKLTTYRRPAVSGKYNTE